MRKYYQQHLYLFLAMAVMSSTAFAENEYINTDRYSLTKVEARTDQIKPLTTVINMSFCADIKTVGKALQELLQGSGYRWANPTEMQNDQLLNELPLPAIVRTLGPIHLNDALDTVAGEAWTLAIDETHRTVWFETANTKITHQ
jgi:conjugative transfer region protein (TIGR03748 family)